MEARKLFRRMEAVTWNPPLLTFTIERHGAYVLGSTRATLQKWTVDVERRTAVCDDVGYRQLIPRQPRLDVAAIAEEIIDLIVKRSKDERLKWFPDGRVRVLVGNILPDKSAVKQTLTAQRKRFRAAVKEQLANHGWQECGVNVYQASTDQP